MMTIHKAKGLMAFVLVVLVLLAGVGTAEASFPGQNGRIAFQSNKDVASGEIYTISPGGRATRITFSNGSSDPAYSPDGSKIAFVSSNPGGTYQIFVMNADGTARRQVTTSATAKSEPAWSPDGTRIIYVSNSFDVDGQTDLEIWRINADGSGRTQLTNNTFPDTQPAWSPLGDKIAFVSTRTGDTDRNVYVMDAGGTNQESVTANSPPGCSANCYKGHDDNPSWAPDGLQIAYSHVDDPAGGGPPQIWTMDPNGTTRAKLSNSATVSYTQPAWSPDGTRIATVRATDTNRDIWVMNSDGGSPKPVADLNHDINPDWQPIPTCTKSGTANNDTLVGTSGKDVICGKGGNDTIKGAGGNDILLGGPGNDTLQGGAANDVINGGTGTDTASYAGITSTTSPVTASLSKEFATGEGSDVFSYVERLTGTAGADKLTGSSGANLLKGLAGNDTLDVRDGTGGNDTVDGGTGSNDACQKDSGDAATNCP